MAHKSAPPNEPDCRLTFDIVPPSSASDLNVRTCCFFRVLGSKCPLAGGAAQTHPSRGFRHACEKSMSTSRRSYGPPTVTMTWSIGIGSASKNCSRRSKSVASLATLLRVPSSRAACSRYSGLPPARTTSAPSDRARLAVSGPIPELPPITTTVCPASSGSRLTSAVGCDRSEAANSPHRSFGCTFCRTDRRVPCGLAATLL
jgi:hypothetical protein